MNEVGLGTWMPCQPGGGGGGGVNGRWMDVLAGGCPCDSPCPCASPSPCP